MKVDFFKIVPRATRTPARTFGQLLDAVLDVPEVERAVEMKDDFVLISDETRRRRTIVGQVGRIRTKDLPPARKPGGQRRKLPMDTGEGLEEGAVFLFDPVWSVLAMEYKAEAPSVRRLISYVRTLTSERAAWDPAVVVDVAASRELGRFRQVSKFEMKVAAPAEEVLRDSGKSAKAIAQLLKAYEAATVSIVVSMGHARSGLNMAAVREAVVDLTKAMATEKESSVMKARLSGTSDDDDAHPLALDLVAERVVEHVSVDSAQQPPSLSDRMRALDEAWLRRRNDLALQFGGGDGTED